MIPAMPALSVYMGVACWMWPISWSVFLNDAAYFALKNSTPVSASVADDKIAFMMDEWT
jgi:hypothetical protein